MKSEAQERGPVSGGQGVAKRSRGKRGAGGSHVRGGQSIITAVKAVMTELNSAGECLKVFQHPELAMGIQTSDSDAVFTRI